MRVQYIVNIYLLDILFQCVRTVLLDTVFTQVLFLITRMCTKHIKQPIF